MRQTILSLLCASLIVASMANVAMAAKHATRHHNAYARKRVQKTHDLRNRNIVAVENRNVFWPKDQNPFGPDNPWPTSGIQPDDWRQSVNGR
jgi:Mg-chelatase subunit ChlI